MIQEVVYTTCPHCSIKFKQSDVLEHFMNAKNDINHPHYNYYKDYSDEDIYEMAQSYGYDKDKPVYFQHDITLMEYSRLYDGGLLYKCNHCNNSWGRFSGIPNIEPEKEARYRLNIPIQKFNSGNGATLCYSCSKIIDTGLHGKELLCNDCKTNLSKLKTN